MSGYYVHENAMIPQSRAYITTTLVRKAYFHSKNELSRISVKLEKGI